MQWTPASAALLSHRLPVALLLSLLHAALSSVLGLHLSLWLNCAAAGAMVVMGGALFTLAWVFSPAHGLLGRWRRPALTEPHSPPCGRDSANLVRGPIAACRASLFGAPVRIYVP